MKKLTRKEFQLELELWIDSDDIVGVLTLLELICLEKAEHVYVNWQDKRLAKVWNRTAGVLSKAAVKIEQVGKVGV